MYFKKNKLFTFVAGALLTSASANVVYAQETSDENADDVERITVTVERRSQSLQDLAGTAVSVSGDDLDILGIQDLTDFAELTPGIEIGNKQGNVEVWIRGIGSSNNTELGDPAAATHLDGVYIPRPTGIGSVFFDIARVEVNIGPQGTLRGRNATAGSVNIISWQPGIGIKDFALEVEAGNYDQVMATGMMNLPVSENSAFRFAGYYLNHDSYYNNVGPSDIGVAEAADNRGYRAQYLWEPNDDLSLLIAADYVSERGTGYTGTNYANPLGFGVDPDDIEDPRDVIARGFTPEQDTSHWGLRTQINYNLGWGELEYIGSFRDLIYDYAAATPLSPDYPGVLETLQPIEDSIDNFSRFQFITDSESTIHELRLMSPDEADFYYTVGAFYFKEEQKAFLGSVGDRGGFFQGAEFNQPDVNAESWSVYGDFTWELTPDTRLTAGLRYTSDEKSRTGVNARYAFALGGFDINTGDPFACCMGARVGTEGFEFAAFDRTIYDPDTDGSGSVSEQEFYDFYLNGIKNFGRRDTLDEILALGPQGGGSETPAPCSDSDGNDSLICPEDGNHSYAVPISPNDSITIQQGEMEDSFIDWRLRIAHDFDEDMMGYGMIVTGHKSGGFNDTFKDPELGIDIAPTYDTEKVTMYETGLKNVFKLGDVRTKFNSSLFYYDYTDQVFSSILSVEQALDFTAGNVVDPDDIAPGALVVSFSYNAADSEIYGAQFDGKFEFANDLTLDWSALWLEAQIEQADDIQDFRFQADVAPDDAVFRSINGKRLPHTPEYQLNLGLSQSIDLTNGSLDYKVSVGWRSEQFLTIFNGEDFAQPDNPRERLLDEVPAYFTVDAGMGYWNEAGNLRLEAFVNNLTNEVRPAAVIITQFDNTRFFTRPRTMGVRLKYYF